MFGHQSDDDKKHDDDAVIQPTEATSDTATDNTASDQSAVSHDDSMVGTAPATDASPTGDQAWQHPGTPLDSSQAIDDVISPAGGYPKKPSFPPGTDHDADSDDPTPSDITEPAKSDLIDIKQKALTELSPLIDELDQTPEERFRTLMMMIQASDNQDLVKDAYAAAHSIEDEKVRAQALLDIVNEINYFTTPHEA